MSSSPAPLKATGAETPTRRRLRLGTAELWPSAAIAVIWLVVLFDALYGPDMIFSNAGTNFTRIPSAVVVAFFAYLATRVVARFGFGERP